jgi:hypothetical protein
LAPATVIAIRKTARLTAKGWLYPGGTGKQVIHTPFKDVGCPKDEDSAGQNGDFFASFGIAPNALALLANRETTKRRYFYVFPTDKRIADFRKDGLNQITGFVPR